MLRDSRNLNLLWELSISQYKLKDQSSFFGFLWSFLNPIFLVVILFVFFRGRFGQDVENYGVYLLLGMIHYTHYSNATNNSMRVFVSMRQLVKEAVFPKELLVLSSTLSNSVDFVIAMGVSMVVAWISGVTPTVAWLALPLVLLLQMLLVSWVSLLLSCVFPFARDIDHIYQVFLRALMFLTPIFYTASFVGDGMARHLLTLNPLAQLIEVSRKIIMDGIVPSWSTLAILFGVNALFVVLTLKGFRRIEARLAEYV
jgi:ABC-type polysaccharide/polyol phosphate export permease